MFKMYLIFSIIVFTYLQISSASLCDFCLCFTTDETQVLNCDKKLVDYNVNDLNSVFVFNKNISDAPNLFIRTIDGYSIIDSDFINSNELKEFYLSFNRFNTLDIEFFSKFPIIKLNLSHNSINYFIEASSINHSNKLINLDLSYNQLTIINETNFQYFSSLKFLNLSFNYIKSIDSKAFRHLYSLNILELNNNQLISFPKNLSVNFLKINNNFIKNIELSDFNDSHMDNKLNFLNISKNKLSSFIDVKFINLNTLDISYNNFSKIPSSINSKNFPNLSILMISGNPLSKLKFNSSIKLKNFIANNISLLNTIDANAFNYLETYPDDCINITISLNKNLKSVSEKLLNHLQLCYLDLSNNYLEQITPNTIKLTNNSFPKYGVNLQKNPFFCDCKLQWMLDQLIPKLYLSHSVFLINLRCNKPQELFNMRMVHWYNWKTKVFCEKYESIKKLENVVIYEYVNISTLPETSTVLIKPNGSVLFLIVGAATVLTIITIIGLFMSHKLLEKRRRQNRRF